MSSHLLLDGEHVIISVRTHIKALFGRFAVGLLILVAGLALGWHFHGTVRLWIAGITVVIVLVWVLPPLLRWLFSTYTLTNVRLIEQQGIFSRSGRVIPLSRVNDVSFEKSLGDRILGCGTLVLHDAGEAEGLRLNDIPHVESFHKTVSELVLKSHGQDPASTPTPTKPTTDPDV